MSATADLSELVSQKDGIPQYDMNNQYNTSPGDPNKYEPAPGWIMHMTRANNFLKDLVDLVLEATILECDAATQEPITNGIELLARVLPKLSKESPQRFSDPVVSRSLSHFL